MHVRACELVLRSSEAQEGGQMVLHLSKAERGHLKSNRTALWVAAPFWWAPGLVRHALGTDWQRLTDLRSVLQTPSLVELESPSNFLPTERPATLRLGCRLVVLLLVSTGFFFGLDGIINVSVTCMWPKRRIPATPCVLLVAAGRSGHVRPLWCGY